MQSTLTDEQARIVAEARFQDSSIAVVRLLPSSGVPC